MRSRERSSRENRRFSSVKKRPEDFFHGLIERRLVGPAKIVAHDPPERQAGTVAGPVTTDLHADFNRRQRQARDAPVTWR